MLGHHNHSVRRAIVSQSNSRVFSWEKEVVRKRYEKISFEVKKGIGERKGLLVAGV